MFHKCYHSAIILLIDMSDLNCPIRRPDTHDWLWVTLQDVVTWGPTTAYELTELQVLHAVGEHALPVHHELHRVPVSALLEDAAVPARYKGTFCETCRLVGKRG